MGQQGREDDSSTARYRTGEVSQVDVLAAELCLAEAELWLTEVGESSR